MRENLKTDATLEAILELVDEVLREDYQPRIERVVSSWCASPFSPDGYYAADEARDVFRAVRLGMPHKVRVKYANQRKEDAMTTSTQSREVGQ